MEKITVVNIALAIKQLRSHVQEMYSDGKITAKKKDELLGYVHHLAQASVDSPIMKEPITGAML